MLDIITRRVRRLSVRARTKRAYTSMPVPRSTFTIGHGFIGDEKDIADRINEAVKRAGERRLSGGSAVLRDWDRTPFHGPECCGSKP